MFRIEPTPWLEGPQNMGPRHGKRVIDHDRDVWLQFVRGSRGPEVAMKLVWNNRVIPFEASREEVRDDPPGEIWYRWRFEIFGATRQPLNDVRPYHFDNPAFRRDAQMLAVEALLAYGSHYSGHKHPDGYDRVEFEGKLYRKSDFGMA